MYPWLHQQWRHLAQRLEQGGFAHAYLFNGDKGIGKEEFALEFAQYLLCHERDQQQLRACGQCHSCQLYQAGNHPDIKLVSPGGASNSITVDQIRELIEYLSLKPHQASYKLAIINAADRMNVAAANSLLKSLEEPPSSSLMFLSTCQPSRLLPTIRSRCQEIYFPLPEREISRPWLASRLEKQDQAELFLGLANGAPLEALQFAEGDMMEHRLQVFSDLTSVNDKDFDAIKIATEWNKLDIQSTLYWLWSFVTDMSRLKVAEYPPVINNPDLADKLRQLIVPIPLKNILGFMRRLENAQGYLSGNMNKQLLLEELMMHWAVVHKRTPKEVFAQ